MDHAKKLILVLIVLAISVAYLPGVAPPVEAEEPESDYIILLDTLSPRPFEDQVSRAVDRVLPRLATLQRQGDLEGFAPIPQAGALLVRRPGPAALEEMAGWAEVTDVVPSDAPNKQAAVTRSQAAREGRILRHERPPEVEAELVAPTLDGVQGVGGLYTLTIYENENEVRGSVYSNNLTIDLTLKSSGGTIKSQVTTVSSADSDFIAYFADTIVGGDELVVQLPGEPPVSVDVVHLSVAPDKVTNVIHGTGPANQQVAVQVFSHMEDQWYFEANVNVDTYGNFAADFGSQVDILRGDKVRLYHYNADGFRVELRDQFVPGLHASLSGSVWGYAAPGETVYLTLKDSGGAIKATAMKEASGSGWFSTDFSTNDPCAAQPEIKVGDRVEMQYAAEPVVAVDMVAVTIDTLDPTNNLVSGTAPAYSKIRVFVDDDYLADYKSRITTAGATGQYSADFGGLLDFTLGSYASVTYHNAQDNEVSGPALYAGPYVKLYVNAWSDVRLAANPNQKVTATLHNALGAIKGTASGTASDSGYLYLDFHDSIGNDVGILPDDRVEVDFAGGGTHSVDAVRLDYIVDRDNRTVKGTGPANSQVQIIYDSSNGANELTGADGSFQHLFGRLTGGYEVQVIHRNPAGHDVERYGDVPQFTVYPDGDYLYGYGPFNQAVVATLKNSGGTVKGTASGVTDAGGYYWLDLASADIVSGDTVEVDVGPLHYVQEIVPLSVQADTANDLVYGTAPPDGWLNVFADLYGYGPYSQYLYKYFYADGAGSFTTNFGGSRASGPGDVRGGDQLEVLYWEDGHQDRVSITRYASPALSIDPQRDEVQGYTTPGASGTVTVRSSGGTVRASGAVNASQPYGSFTYSLPAGTDMITGDRVTAQVGVLDRTADVIPLYGALNMDTDTATGTSLPDKQIGLQIYHWRGTYYTSYTENGSMQQSVDTNASGAFSLDVGCLADLSLGDYLGLYYIDNQDTRYSAYFYTTQPVVTVASYPPAVQPGAPVEVFFNITGGVHPTSANVRWDTESHAGDNDYAHSTSWQRGVSGSNVASFGAPLAGTVYFKAYAYVDGQTIWSQEHSFVVQGEIATTLIDPVSGTTNDATPYLTGVAPAGAQVILYEGAAQLATTTAAPDGWFSFNISVPTAASSSASVHAHEYHAIATMNGNPGPSSNVLNLTVDPTLIVDPVHILLTTRGTTQHLRDDRGFANLGGRIWTRTSDVVAASIPISCTDVYTADLYVGGVWATSMIDSGDSVYVGTYTPPTNGTYHVDLRARCGGPGGPVQTVNILTGLIDPDGYVYDSGLGQDHRLAGAQVTCYELVDEATNTWQPWSAGIWDQKNPQTTSADGYYAFFTLPGKYRVKATAPRYMSHESPTLTVVDAPVHYNVGLQPLHLSYLPIILKER